MGKPFHGGISFDKPTVEAIIDFTEILSRKDGILLTRWVDEPALSVGAHVAGGEIVGSLAGVPVRSSLSGVVTALEADPQTARFRLTVRADRQNIPLSAEGFGKRRGQTFPEVDPAELMNEIRTSGIIEQSGEALAAHLERALSEDMKGKLHLAAACCFDLDPLCATNGSITEEKAAAVAGGLTILLKLLNLKEGAMLCDRRQRKSIRAAELACADSKLIAIELTENRYPQAHPKLLTRWLMERELAPSSRPENAGLFLTDAETCASLYRLFAKGLPEPFKRVSVFGRDGLRAVDLPLGLSLSELPALGLLSERERVCTPRRGGLDGRPLPERVDAALNGLVCLPDGACKADFPSPEQINESEKTKNDRTQRLKTLFEDRSGCIGCGKCADVCPMFLLPYDYLLKNKLKSILGGLPQKSSACIGCGCCSYICPAGLPLRTAVLTACGDRISQLEPNSVHGKEGSDDASNA